MNRSSGFTLIELMVVVAVAAILLLVALPSMRNFVQNNRITGEANQIHSSLNLARSEALKSQLTVYVDALSSGGAGNEFGNGWRVFRDDDADGTYDGVSELIGQVDALPGGTTLDATTNTTRLTFNPSGTATSNTLQLRIPECRGNQGRNIVISPIGRVSVSTVGC